MKNQIKSLLLIACLINLSLPAWSQASTQGKEFWVSSSLVCSPDKATPTPYIAVSAEKACTVTITGGDGNAINITQQVAAGSWNEFGNVNKEYQTDPTQGPINVQMDASKWYPTNVTNANNVYQLAGVKNNFGLHITATENVSVYVILSSTHSMDASNILPITAIQSEYYTQDYWSKVKSDFNDAVGLTTILATEDNTVIDITPNGDTYDGWRSGSLHQITLNKGQTYYLVTEKGNRLAGSHIVARNGRKIAVFCGVPITNIPTGIAARDCLFEQSMPVDYWGTQFIVTRSLEKNANLIGITATQRGTEIKVDGYTQAYINEGETYYIMLQGASNPAAKDTATSHRDLVVTQDVAYIETSCPCAVYSYDTGNSFKGSDGTEIVGGKGDPSSVWISPIQQKISQITFGTCYTSKTKDHFLNIVAETATCQTTTLSAIFGATTIDKTSLLQWQTVPGNPTYSYARAKIGDADTEKYSVFRLKSDRGFIAIVYGNGDDESYAYSAGSAAVEQGVNVNGVTFTNGYISNDKFCFGDVLEFDAKVGTDEISRVDWDFGDGISQQNGDVQTTHEYTVPGWYDVRAELYGHQVCTDDADQFLGAVQFSFRVVRPDTQYIYVHDCKDEDWQGELKNDTTWPTVITDCSNIEATVTIYGKNSSSEDEVSAQDSYYEPLTGITYPQNPDDPNEYDQVIDINLTELFGTKNATDCDTIIHRRVRIITCLDMSIPNDSAAQHVCPGENLEVSYTFRKGSIGDAFFVLNGQRTAVDPDQGVIILPVDNLKPGTYKAMIAIDDPNCQQTLEFPLDIAVYYPNDIFKYKYNNVLAVYKKGFGGNVNPGYDFVGYQWYRNGEAISGATESIYHAANPFTLNDSYYVVLTRADGVVLPSCELVIDNVPDFNQQGNGAPVKVLQNQRMYILRDDQVYDIFGQRVK